MYAFSNGKPDDLVELLKFNGIINYFDDIISVDPIKSFKPDPAVYLYLLRKTNGYHANVYMVSSNPLDVIGAKNAGLFAVWVNRDKKGVYDPWEIEPDFKISCLNKLIDVIL